MNSLSIVAVGLLMDWHVHGSEDLRAPRARILLQIVSSLHSICAGQSMAKTLNCPPPSLNCCCEPCPWWEDRA